MSRNNTIQIEIRDARTNDEAWMLEKLNQDGLSIDSFSPREFLVSVDAKTEERMAFGRTEYIRNVDDTEYVEINSFVILNRAEPEYGCKLLDSLSQKALDNDKNQLFAFPHRNKDVFHKVGFVTVESDELPTVMKERYKNKVQNHGEDAVPMTAVASNISYEVDDNDDEFEKPANVDDEEIEAIKEDLDIDDSTSTKYQT
jgi:N-acetylglutamate synthase-like GNAT family acetyltransferase